MLHGHKINGPYRAAVVATVVAAVAEVAVVVATTARDDNVTPFAGKAKNSTSFVRCSFFYFAFLSAQDQ